MKKPKLLRLFILLVSIKMLSCSEAPSRIDEIWLRGNLEWKESKTGLPEIDTIRTETNTEVLVLFGNKLAFGNIILYRDNQSDSITIAYEAGEMLLSDTDCFLIKGYVKGGKIRTNQGELLYQEQGKLIYNDELFRQAKYFDIRSKNELLKELNRLCR